jgi:hypothetical protein
MSFSELTIRAVVMTVSMIPMFVLWWNVEGILLKLGQGAFLSLIVEWMTDVGRS